MSSVCEYNISTKFFRHGTFTSFFTVCKRKTEVTYNVVFAVLTSRLVVTFQRNIMPPSSGLKHRYPRTDPHGTTTWKTVIDIFTTIKTSNIIPDVTPLLPSLIEKR
jgi:hypothetical protein